MTTSSRIPLALWPALLTLFHGCGATGFFSRLDEGVIEYSLSFPEYDPNGIMSGMLPERTLLTFRDNRQVAELSAGMGLFRTAMVTDDASRTLDYRMSMMGKRITANMRSRDLDVFVADSGMPTIIYTNDMDSIAGYPCRRAVAIFDRIDHPEIELWYTDRIALKDPNWYGPFAEVPGVLLRYEVVQYGMRMRLTAISVKPGNVDETKFAPSQDHDPVEPSVLHHEMAEVLGTFSM